MAKSISYALSLALPLILVRQFDVKAFGVYKWVFLLVTSVVGLLPPGIGMTAFYFLPREPESMI